MYRIYGTTTCGFCKRATKLLQERGFSYTYYSLDNDDALLSHLQNKYNWRTVPLVLYAEWEGVDDDEASFIGGYTDLVKWLDDDKTV